MGARQLIFCQLTLLIHLLLLQQLLRNPNEMDVSSGPPAYLPIGQIPQIVPFFPDCLDLYPNALKFFNETGDLLANSAEEKKYHFARFNTPLVSVSHYRFLTPMHKYVLVNGLLLNWLKNYRCQDPNCVMLGFWLWTAFTFANAIWDMILSSAYSRDRVLSNLKSMKPFCRNIEPWVRGLPKEKETKTITSQFLSIVFQY